MHDSRGTSRTDMRKKKESASAEDGPDGEEQESSDEDESGQRRGRGTARLVDGGMENAGKSRMWNLQRRPSQNAHGSDPFVGAEEFGTMLSQSESTMERRASSPRFEKARHGKHQNGDSSEEEDGDGEDSHSRDSDTEYNTSEEGEGDSETNTTQATGAPTSFTTPQTDTDMERERWSERLVGLSNSRSAGLSRDSLQDRLRARFDNLVQQVAARLSSSLLAPQSIHTRDFQSRAILDGGTSRADSLDAPNFRLFDPSPRSAEVFEDFPRSDPNTIQRLRRLGSEPASSQSSPLNHMGPESPHEPPPLMLFEPLLISSGSSDTINSKSPGVGTVLPAEKGAHRPMEIKLRRQQKDMTKVGSSDGVPEMTGARDNKSALKTHRVERIANKVL